MPVFELPMTEISFPHPDLAEPDGLLAVGGDLSPERLLTAYSLGIFPWFNEDNPILWWSPDPRMVLFPRELKVARSMRPLFNQKKFETTVDTAFEHVIRNCRETRLKGDWGTWITEEMVAAYCRLHELGYAHSVEVWQEGRLVGGLYGIALGRIFFGESMFSNVPNASKFGFVTFVKMLEQRGFWLVDCQQQTRHLANLGARAISRTAFLDWLQKNAATPTPRGKWAGWGG